MQSLLNAATVLLPLAYLLLVVDYGIIFSHGHRLAHRTAPPLLAGTLFLHTGYLLAMGVKWGQLPMATVPQALTVVAFAVALVYALVEWLGQERSTGVWMLSLVFLFQLLSSILGGGEPPILETFREPLFIAHIFLALLGYAAFVVAGTYGFLFLRLYRELKSGSFRLFYGRLPPLEVLDRMTSRALLVGFLALTGAVAGGVWWALRIDYAGWWRDPKIVMTGLTWVLYGLALGLRRLRQWQGRHTALASLAGLVAILLSLLIVNFASGSFHGTW